jgi:DNA-binding response OmpR family regulator
MTEASVVTASTQVTLVILDDDSAVVSVLSRLLQERLHLTVQGFTNGGAAMAWLSCHPAQLLIVDYLMPGPSGLDVVRWLRKQPGHETTPVLMLTGMDGPYLSAAATLVGVNRLICKPITSDALLRAVELLLRPASHDAAVASD